MAEAVVPLCSQCNKNLQEVHNEEFYESWTSTQIQVVKLRHTWTINNFSLCCREKGQKLESSTFSAGNNSEMLEWQLSISPNGAEIEKSKDNVSLFLNLVRGSKDGTLSKFKCGIVNAKGENVKIMDSVALFTSGKCWGSGNFISQKCLLDDKNGYLLDDKLTIFCEIIAEVGSRKISGTLAPPQSDLGFDFTFLLESKNLNDVILTADGKEFPAHKVILSARSPVFRAMFQHDMEEKRNNQVKITDIDEEGLGEMLRYMYTGKINKLEEMAPRLLGIADKYQLDDLKTICETALLKMLSLENVVEVFILSDKFSATDLKNEIKQFIAAHGADLGSTPGFKSLFRTHPYLALEAFCTLNGSSCTL